jgi:hypothetical protein
LIAVAVRAVGSRDGSDVGVFEVGGVVVLSLGGAHLESGTSAVVGEDEVGEGDEFGGGRADDVPDVAGVGLDVGESLAILVDFVEDEADVCGSDGVVGEGVDLELVAGNMRQCPPVAH